MILLRRLFVRRIISDQRKCIKKVVGGALTHNVIEGIENQPVLRLLFPVSEAEGLAVVLGAAILLGLANLCQFSWPKALDF
jgi:hypothetical protein